jgi:hypothetical protein
MDHAENAATLLHFTGCCLVVIFVVVKIRRKWPSHNNARIGSKKVHNIVPCFYSKMLLHVSAFLIGHHQAYIKVLKLS